MLCSLITLVALQSAPPLSSAPCTLAMELPHPRHQLPFDIDDEFGFDVATDGDLAVVGAPEYDGHGAAVVFRRLPNNAWAVDQWFAPSSLNAGDRFGASVDIDGNVAVIGAPGIDIAGSDEGSAFVFRRNSTTGAWVREDTLEPDLTLTPNGFANDLSIHADTIAVGEPSGHVGYVFRHSAGAWPLEDTVVSPLPGSGTSFGEAIAVYGDILLVGDDRYNPPTMGKPGIAFTYKRTGSSWNHADTLLNPNPSPSADHFAEGIDLDGSWAVIGTPQLDAHGLTASGTVFAFELDADGMELQRQEVNPGATFLSAGDNFGYDVAVHGTTMIVGAPRTAPGFSSELGAAYQFDLVNGTWQLTQDFPGNGVTLNDWDRFGWSVSVGTFGIAGGPSPGAVGIPGRAFIGNLCNP